MPYWVLIGSGVTAPWCVTGNTNHYNLKSKAAPYSSRAWLHPHYTFLQFLPTKYTRPQRAMSYGHLSCSTTHPYQTQPKHHNIPPPRKTFNISWLSTRMSSLILNYCHLKEAMTMQFPFFQIPFPSMPDHITTHQPTKLKLKTKSNNSSKQDSLHTATALLLHQSYLSKKRWHLAFLCRLQKTQWPDH